MNNSQRIFRRKTMRLDNNVWIVVVALAIIFEGFYLYKLINPPKRIPFTFTIKKSGASSDTGIFKQKDYLYFEASPANQNIIWDFGDNKEQLQGTPVAHQFDTTGKFEVKVKLGGLEYVAREELTIMPIELPKIRIYKIMAGDSAEIDKPASFYCPDSAGSYDWSVKDYPDLTAKSSGTGNQHTFTFPIANKIYTVECKLDKDKSKTATWEIYIKPKPVVIAPGPKNVKSRAEICNQEVDGQKFQTLLKDGLYGTFPPGNFRQFLCNADATLVTVNGKLQMTFGEFIVKLSSIPEEDKFDKRRDNAQRIKIGVVIEREDQMVDGEFVKQLIKTLKIYVQQETSNVKGGNVKTKDYSFKSQ